MNPPLSNRLRVCCALIQPGDRVADIGTDHGYLGIWLLQRGVASAVYAADIHPGPLDSAQRNARKYDVADRMSFILSDGASNVPRDFDVMVCAGMGADTMIHILDDSPWLRCEHYRLILQCQSRRPALREYLYQNGWRIRRETLAQDGKFIYPVMEAIFAPSEPLTPGGYYISPALRECGSPLLPAFYDRVLSGVKAAYDGLSLAGDGRAEGYRRILQELLEMEEEIHDNRR